LAIILREASGSKMNFFVLIIEMNEHSTLPKLIQKFIWNTEVLKVVGANEYERTCWLRSNPGAMLEIDKSERLIMEFINEQRMRIMNGVKEMKYKEFLEVNTVCFTKRIRNE
jgi:hypothetical protein